MRHHNEILIKHNDEEFLADMTVNIEKLHDFINLTYKIEFQFSQINNLKRAECIMKHIMKSIDKF